MEIRFSINWQIVVDCQVDTLDIDTSAKDISGNTDSFVEVFELLVSLDSERKVSFYLYP